VGKPKTDDRWDRLAAVPPEGRLTVGASVGVDLRERGMVMVLV
jgi:hypothetical protein